MATRIVDCPKCGSTEFRNNSHVITKKGMNNIKLHTVICENGHTSNYESVIKPKHAL